jgi:hypothetical protein
MNGAPAAKSLNGLPASLRKMSTSFDLVVGLMAKPVCEPSAQAEPGMSTHVQVSLGATMGGPSGSGSGPGGIGTGGAGGGQVATPPPTPPPAGGFIVGAAGAWPPQPTTRTQPLVRAAAMRLLRSPAPIVPARCTSP